VRQAAEELLRQQGPRYAVVFNTAKAIADLCSARLAYPVQAKPASGYVVRVTYGERETPESLRAQCVRIATWARARADDAGHDRGAVTLLWATIADYFAEAAKGSPLQRPSSPVIPGWGRPQQAGA
jgi:hypothetical protein